MCVRALHCSALCCAACVCGTWARGKWPHAHRGALHLPPVCRRSAMQRGMQRNTSRRGAHVRGAVPRARPTNQRCTCTACTHAYEHACAQDVRMSSGSSSSAAPFSVVGAAVGATGGVSGLTMAVRAIFFARAPGFCVTKGAAGGVELVPRRALFVGLDDVLTGHKQEHRGVCGQLQTRQVHRCVWRQVHPRSRIHAQARHASTAVADYDEACAPALALRCIR